MNKQDIYNCIIVAGIVSGVVIVLFIKQYSLNLIAPGYVMI